VDGEGYLGVAGIRRPRRSPEFCLRLSIYNSDRAILEEIQAEWGGTLSCVGQRRTAWKPSFALIWTNAAAAQVIRRLRPFLVVKSGQAEALLEFDARIRSGRRIRDSGGHLLPLPRQEVRARERVYRRLKRMNKTGREDRGGYVRLEANGKRSLSPEYVAGFIDAEGSLMIARSNEAGCRTPQYRARIAAVNTQRGVLESIRRTYGGILVHQPARRPGWSHSYQLVWSGGIVPQLLLSVGAHLRLKSKQARILSEFVRHQSTTKRIHNGKVFLPFPRRVVAFREKLRKEITELNHRGSRGATRNSRGPDARPRRARQGGW
jgi:hypothetical protein